MKIEDIKQGLKERSIFLAESELGGRPAVIGYDKVFKWRWFATQLNTFIIAADLGKERITEQTIETFLNGAFEYAKKNYRGWPRGLQSGFGVIAILISENVVDGAAAYCRQLKSGKKWAGFSIPVVINSRTQEVFRFEKDPFWGRIYYPYFRELIDELI